HFCAPEERQGLQRLDRRSNSPGGLISVICDAIDYFQAETASVVGHQFLRQPRRRVFYFSLIRADDRVYICGFRFGFRLRHRRFLACAAKIDKVDRLLRRRWWSRRGLAASANGPKGGPSPFTNSLRTTRSTYTRERRRPVPRLRDVYFMG